MRIISKYHDYYDTAMGFGQDQELIYLRTPKKIKKRVGPIYKKRWYRRFNSDLAHDEYVVGFCGKIYGCVKLTRKLYNHELVRYEQHEEFCYDIESADKFISDNFKKKRADSYFAKKKRYSWKSMNNDLGVGHYELKLFFDNCKKDENKYSEFFIEHHSPIFVSHANSTIFNDSLKAIEFFKIIDPYTAFQEISMYLGGLASPEKPIPHVSDADMLQAKGFDSKTSFRKDPSKKGKKKNK